MVLSHAFGRCHTVVLQIYALTLSFMGGGMGRKLKEFFIFTSPLS